MNFFDFSDVTQARPCRCRFNCLWQLLAGETTSGAHAKCEVHPFQAEGSGLTNAPLELVMRESPEDQGAEER